MDEHWLSNEGLAERYGVPVATVRRWRYTGEGPPGVRFGRHVRYLESDVEAWVAAKRLAERTHGARREAYRVAAIAGHTNFCFHLTGNILNGALGLRR